MKQRKQSIRVMSGLRRGSDYKDLILCEKLCTVSRSFVVWK